jgi:hypothetical protein
MRKFHVHDTINDIAVIETRHCFYVRYGLENTVHVSLASALDYFNDCVRHALRAEIEESQS